MPTINPISWICWPSEISLFRPWKQADPIDRLATLEVGSKQSVICESFYQFLEEYETEIFPYYEKRQQPRPQGARLENKP